MSERATERLPVKPKTKKLIDEQKPDGVTYDHWLRTRALGVDE